MSEHVQGVQNEGKEEEEEDGSWQSGTDTHSDMVGYNF